MWSDISSEVYSYICQIKINLGMWAAAASQRRYFLRTLFSVIFSFKLNCEMSMFPVTQCEFRLQLNITLLTLYLKFVMFDRTSMALIPRSARRQNISYVEIRSG